MLLKVLPNLQCRLHQLETRLQSIKPESLQGGAEDVIFLKMYMHVRMCVCMGMRVKGQLAGSALIPPSCFLVRFEQVPLPAEPPHRSLTHLLCYFLPLLELQKGVSVSSLHEVGRDREESNSDEGEGWGTGHSG